MAVTAEDYVNVLMHSYNKTNIGTNNSEGVSLGAWSRIYFSGDINNPYQHSDVLGGSATDLEISAYRKDNNVVVTFEGFDASLIEAFETFDVGVGLLGVYFAQSYFFVKEIIDEVLKVGDELSFTGHSQGGAMAAIMAEYFGVGLVGPSGAEIVAGSTTFNGQSASQLVSQLSIVTQVYYVYNGVAQEFPRLAPTGEVVPWDDTIVVPPSTAAPDSGGIINYRFKDDVASHRYLPGTLIGEVIEIDLGSGGSVSYHGIALMRLAIFAGKDPNDVDKYWLQTLQAKYDGLMGHIIDDDLHVDLGTSGDNDPDVYERYLIRLVNTEVEGGRPLVDLLFEDFAKIIELEDTDRIDALLQLAIQHSDWQLDQSGQAAGIYFEDENAFKMKFEESALFDTDPEIPGKEYFVPEFENRKSDILNFALDSNENAQLQPFLPTDFEIEAFVVVADEETDGLMNATSVTDANTFFLGSDEKDIVEGDVEDDFIFGEDGDDELSGGGGTNFIAGGFGEDMLTGGDEVDQFDALFGEGDNDELMGGKGKDFLHGGDDDDVLKGGEGEDLLFGGLHNDTLYGNDEGSADDGVKDELTGGPGGDIFHVGANDIVMDAEPTDPEDSGDRVKWNDEFLTGATRNADGRYIGDLGEEYLYPGEGEDLTIVLPGGAGEVIVKEFDNTLKDGGIHLKHDVPYDASRFYSPLVLDLDGDGIELIELERSGAFFDIDLDGFAEHISWVGPDDGLLTLDRNGDGFINDFSELFGAKFVITSPSLIPDFSVAESGFGALYDLDANFDFLIDQSDPVYQDLRVWRDQNGNGLSAPSELLSLSELGIESIDLDYAAVAEYVSGSIIAERSLYQSSDGSEKAIVDVHFAYDALDTRELGELVDISSEIQALPSLPGRGEASSLHVAMVLDPLLQEMVEELVGLELSEVHLLSRMVEEIILRWHEADDVSPTSRGSAANAQHLAVIESLQGFDFLQGGQSSYPAEDAGRSIEESWQDYHAEVMAGFLAQIPLGQTIVPDLDYQLSAFFTVPEGTTVTSLLESAAPAAPSDPIEQIMYWHSIARVLWAIQPEISSDTSSLALEADAFFQGVGVNFSYVQLQDARIGGDGDETLTGDRASNVFLGGEGDDVFSGTLAHSTFIIARGQGQDLVRGQGGIYRDETLFFLDLNFEDLSFSINHDGFGDNLLISVNDSPDMLELRPFFWNGEARVTSFQFADGTELDWADIASQLFGGTPGDDFLVAVPIGAILDGGTGNDVLTGQEGDDTFVFGTGYGADRISERLDYAVSTDVVSFTAELSFEDLSFERSSDPDRADLIIRINGTSDVLTVEEQFSRTLTPIEVLEFADGTSIPIEDVKSLLLAGTPDDDLILGTAQVDRFGGDAGNDTLFGAAGGDIYEFGIGSGRDVIFDPEGFNKVELGPGILSSDLEIAALSGTNDLIIQLAGYSDSLTIVGFFSYSNGGVQDILFDDGTLLTHTQIEALVGPQNGSSFDVPSIQWGSANTADVLTGGAGYDILSGGGGGDVHIFGLGHDVDLIWTNFYGVGENFVRFEAGISPDDLILNAGEDSYGGFFDPSRIEITVRDTDDKLIVDELAFRKNDPDQAQITEYQFADGTVWTNEYLEALYEAGSDGDDIIATGQGSQTLDGGILGNDMLDGGDDSDTYLFGRGYGQDLVGTFSSNGGRPGTDRVLFTDLNFEDVTFELSIENPLTVDYFDVTFVNISVNDTDDELVVLGWNNVQIYEFADGTVLSREEVLEPLLLGDDTVYNDPVLGGGPGNDVIIGTFFGDTILAGPGDDLLLGGGYRDEYYYYLGDGNDTIDSAREGGDGSDSRKDKLFFGPGISAAEVTLSYSVHDLIITIDVTGERVTILNELDMNDDNILEEIIFDNGFTWTRDDTYAIVSSSSTLDNLRFGTSGSETLDGGLGRDRLEGLEGDDTYLFDAGYGEDTVFDSSGTADLVQFGAGIDPSMIISARTVDGLSLVLSFTGLTDSLTIEGGIETFEFVDGTVLTFEDIFGGITSQEVSDGPDLLVGVAGNTVLDGGPGNDQIFTADGNTVVFGPESDHDLISSNAPNVTIAFSAGLTPDDILLERVGTVEGSEDLVISLRMGDASLTVENQFDPAHQVASFLFEDGTSWSQIEMQQEMLARSVTNRDDVLVGTEGDDTFDGAAGDDEIIAKLGADVVLINRGSGHDTLKSDLPASNSGPEEYFADTVVFGTDIVPTDIQISADLGRSVTLTLSGGSDSLTIETMRMYDGEVTLSVGQFEFDDGTVWTLGDVLSQAYGLTNGDDVYINSFGPYPFSQYFYPLDGGLGDDYLIGSADEDLYVFGRGYGTDTIDEDGFGFFYDPYLEDRVEIDIVSFNPDIAPSDLSIGRGGVDQDDLIIDVIGTEDRLIILNQLDPFEGFETRFESFNSSAGFFGYLPVEDPGLFDIATEEFEHALVYARGVDELHFSDGTVWDRDAIAGMITELVAFEGDAILTTDHAGGDLDGGSGNDLLQGGTGNDTYFFDRGYGEDRIEDAGGVDEVRFGADVPLALLSFSRIGEAGQDLLIEVAGEERLTLTIAGQFGAGENRVERFVFDDGTTLSWQDIQNIMLDRAATTLDDVIEGFNTDDIVMGREGADTLTGGLGDDTLFGGPGRDTAVFSGAESDYTVVVEADRVTVTDLRSGGDGVDTLYDVEDLLFLGDPPPAGEEEPDLVNLVAENQAPTADDDTAQTDEDTKLDILLADLLANDSDPEGLALELVEIAAVENGIAWINLAGNVSFEPTADFAGDATIDYVIADPDNATATGTITVTVDPINDAPRGLSFATGAVAENSADGTMVDQVVVDDPDAGDVYQFTLLDDAGGRFALDSLSGDVTVADGGLLDYETATAHSIQVQVSDLAGEVYSQSLTITLGDLNEAPTDLAFAGTTSVDENSVTGRFIGVVTTSDPDANETITYGLSNDAGGRFAIDAASGILVVANGLMLNHEAAASHDIVVEATDSDNLTYSETITIQIEDVNEAPTGLSLNNTTVDENSANGTVVGTLAGDDPDDNDSLTYGLLDNAGGRFALDAASGILTVADGSLLDYETAAGHDITVLVADSGFETFSETFMISVMNVDEGGDPVGETIIGTNGDDILTGTAGNDTIYGKKGNDTIYGLAGDDVIDGGGDNDALDGGDGSDTYLGVTSVDIITDTGMGGLDVIQFGATASRGYLTQSFNAADSGIEEIHGNAAGDLELRGSGSTDEAWDFTGIALIGIDFVDGRLGNDQITGSGAGDHLLGGEGNDVLSGGAGDDTLEGNNGTDTLLGGPGDDSLTGGGHLDTLDGGEGSDSYYSVGLDLYADSGLSGIDTIFFLNGGYDGVLATTFNAADSGIEVIDGSAKANNTLVPDSSNALWDLTGITLIGFDYIFGSVGDDSIVGTAGDDTIYGSHGNDVIDGGAGNDILSGKFGFEPTTATATSSSLLGGLVPLLQSALFGEATTSAATVVLDVDTLLGGLGDDILKGDAVDTLDGGEGSDIYQVSTVDGGFINDSGTSGVDTILFEDGASYGVLKATFNAADNGIEVIDGSLAPGFDLKGSGDGLDEVWDFTGITLLGIDEILMRPGDDQVIGSAADDHISGENGNDTLNGAAGNDTLEGNHGDDILLGGLGDDVITGYKGSDILEGGLGDDILSGEQDSDTFIFKSGDGNDIILDFQAGAGSDDVIDLSGTALGDLAAVLAVTTQSGADAVFR